MASATARAAFHKNRRRCKTITGIVVSLGCVLMAAGLLSQAEIAFVWLTEETLVDTGFIIIVAMVVLLTVLAPRCPHCGRKVPQVGLEGERNVGLEADACPSCLHSLPR